MGRNPATWGPAAPWSPFRSSIIEHEVSALLARYGCEAGDYRALARAIAAERVDGRAKGGRGRPLVWVKERQWALLRIVDDWRGAGQSDKTVLRRIMKAGGFAGLSLKAVQSALGKAKRWSRTAAGRRWIAEYERRCPSTL
jgi:hypothetical protein